MRLVDAYSRPIATVVLYGLLQEREAHQSISHRELPLFEEHERFVRGHPYPHWYLIENDDTYIGAVYLTHQDEIGIFIARSHQGRGYGSRAVRLLMQTHPRDRFLANINPKNSRSIKFFERLGFSPLQHTYELRP